MDIYEKRRREEEEAKKKREDDNFGRVVPSIGSGVGIAIGIGSGLTIDPSDGSLGVSIGGVGVDF